MNLNAFRSLSRALLRGFVRDRTALVFSLLLPVLFLALFGSIYRSTSTPKLTVIQYGQVSLLDNAGPALAKVLTVTHASSWENAQRKVHQGDADAAIEQVGHFLYVRYSIADPTKGGIVQTVFSSIVQAANQASVRRSGGYTLLIHQAENRALSPIQFLAPGLLGWAIASGAAFGAAITLVNLQHSN